MMGNIKQKKNQEKERLVQYIWQLIKETTSIIISIITLLYLSSLNYALKRIAIKKIPLYDENNVRYDVNYVINEFIPEATVLIKFEHDNIIKYHKHFAINHYLYIVTEYCEVQK